MNVVFLGECAADGCYKKAVKGKQLCREHQDAYDRGELVKAFYGKTLKKNADETCNQEKKPLPAMMVRRVKMLQRRAGLGDDDYRAMLSGYGVESCRDLDIVDALRIIGFLQGIVNRIPEKRPGLKYETMGFRDGFATPRQLRMLEALWKDVSVVVDDAAGRHAAFQQFLWNKFNIVSVENIQQCDVGRIKKTLESMLYAKNSKRKEG